MYFSSTVASRISVEIVFLEHHPTLSQHSLFYCQFICFLSYQQPVSVSLFLNAHVLASIHTTVWKLLYSKSFMYQALPIFQMYFFKSVFKNIHILCLLLLPILPNFHMYVDIFMYINNCTFYSYLHCFTIWLIVFFKDFYEIYVKYVTYIPLYVIKHYSKMITLWSPLNVPPNLRNETLLISLKLLVGASWLRPLSPQK